MDNVEILKQDLKMLTIRLNILENKLNYLQVQLESKQDKQVNLGDYE